MPYSEKVDVYSYGILLNELVVRNWAHFELEQEEIVELVKNEGLRPEIPDWCPDEMQALMTICWDQRPEKRPSFNAVINMLSSLDYAKWGKAANETPAEDYEEEVVVEEEEGD